MLLKRKLRNEDPHFLTMSEERQMPLLADSYNAGCSLLMDKRPVDNSGVQYDKLTKTVGEFKAYHSKLKGDAFINYNV